MTLSAFYVDNSHPYYNPKKAKELLEFVFKIGLEAFKKNPSQLTLLFKVAEAAIHRMDGEEKSRIVEEVVLYLDQIDAQLLGIWKNHAQYQLKRDYLKVLFARKLGNWQEVKTILEGIKINELPFIKQGTIINALIELERGRLYLYENNLLEAKKHLQISENLIERKYGSLHPYALSVYNEILHSLDSNDFSARAVYQEKISKITALFPSYQWQGAIDASLLD